MPIYLIQEVPDGAVKIGYTGGDPFARIASLQTGNSKPLKLLAFAPGSPQHERGLHERFADLRLHGEWFRPDPRLLGFIDGMRWAFPEEQKRKPTEAKTQYGFTDEQVQFITGIVQGHAIGDAIADADLIALCQSGALSEQEVDALAHAQYLAGEITGPFVPVPQALLDGRQHGANLGAIDSTVDRIREALARHHMAAAEQRLADDRNDGADPSVDGAWAEVDAHNGTFRDEDDLLPHEAH